MTETGQVPGEGQPGRAGAQPEPPQPGTPAAAPGAYTYAGPEGGPAGASGDDEDLLMPGAQGAWSEAQGAAAQQHAPAPRTHESDGRDSGAIDYGAVRTPHSGTPVPGGAAPGQAAGRPAAGQPRRPLHLGPPVPEQSGAVRSLADRGPSAPAPQPAPEPASGSRPRRAARQPAPEAQHAGAPEYLDVSPQGPEQLAAPRNGGVPAQQDAWTAQSPTPTPTPTPATPEPVEPAEPAEHGSGGVPLPGPGLVAAPPAAPGPDAAGTEAETTDGTPVPAGVPADAAAPVDTGQAVPAPLPAPGEDAAAPADADAVAEPRQAGETAEAGPSAPAQNGAVRARRGKGPQHAAPAPAQGPAPAPDAVPGPMPVPEPAPVPVPGAVPDAAGPESAPVPDPQNATPDPGAPGDGRAVAAIELPPAAEPPAAAQVPGDPGPAPAGAEGASAAAPQNAPEMPDAGDGPDAGAPAAQAGSEPEPEPEPEAVPPQEPHGTAPPPAESATPAAPAALAPVVPSPRAHEADTPDTPGTGAGPADGSGTTVPEDQTHPVPEADPAPPISGDGPAAEAAPSTGGGTPDEQPADEQPSEDTAEEAAPAVPVTAAAPVTPAAPGYDEADRETVHRLMRERRDIRNGFRSDPIPHEVLLRVLEAAHTAPSVGHSQPWDFVVIRSGETRRSMHELAQRQREAYAKSLPKARAKQFKELKIEAILDTPVNIVVTADPTRGGRHTLGRHTQPQMAPYSSALAVENLWLAARAEGLGVGWVSFFDERELVRTLDLPDHLEVVAYLCVGYVDEFPPEPELMQAGWSKRRPLSWVVHEESYGRRALPGAEPHDLLAETLERIRPLDAKALGEAWERQKRMTKPAGALGMLEIISAQLCGLSRQCPPPIPEPAAVAVFAGDHGVHAQGVTPWPQEVTAQMVANFLGGGAVCNAFANQVGAEVCIVDVGVAGELPATPGLLPRKVRAGTADMTQGPALSREEVLRAIEVGIETARDLVAAGNKALVTGEMGIANTTVSAALIAVCTGADAAEVTGRGTGISDETHSRKVEVVRRALQLHQPDPADPVGMLAAIGGLEHAALTGLILGGASLRTPVVLDGVSAGAAALVARQIAPEALAACIAGHRSAEPGHVAALTKLGLRPLIDLDLRLGEGTGALLALPMVQSAARAMHEVATFDSAGVTEKG